ncbi:MAG: hypothetical protein NVS1B4_22120 [Gemmatimonadaceae bacterium]
MRFITATIAVASLFVSSRAAHAQSAAPLVSADTAASTSQADTGRVAERAARSLAPVRVEAAPEPRSLGYRVLHIEEERQTVLALRRENRRLEHELKEYDRTIERLELRLARAIAVHDSLRVARLAAKPQLDRPWDLNDGR